MTSKHGRDVLQGDLSEANLPEILQLIHSLKHDGQLLIEGVAGDGQSPLTGGIYFKNQAIVHAALPPLSGLDAFRRILTLDSGRFLYIRDAQSSQHSIKVEFNALMLDGLRYQDEFSLAASNLPKLHVTLYPTYDQSILGNYNFSHNQWQLFDLVDGSKSIQDLMYICASDNIITLNNIHALMKASYIYTKPQHGFLDNIVLHRLPPEEREFFPMKRLTPMESHILRFVDGHENLAMIAKETACTAHELIQSVEHLLRYRWVCVIEDIQIARNHFAL